MRARKSVLSLPSGRSVETPLVVPSVSSKGAGRSGPDERPGSFEQIDVFEATLPALRRPVGLLVSSYDLQYGFIPQERFRDAARSLPVDLLLVDSGSYETLPFEGDPPFLQDKRALPWDEWMFEATIESLQSATDVALVSFDKHDTYEAQIESAGAFFRRHPGAVSDVLLKPPPGRDAEAAAFHDLDSLAPHAAALDAFQIIGVTEKELDATPVGRLVTLARLRELLDEAGVARPIHVFGGLDPLWTPLYIAAGAEIIDGLSWWRYAFDDGIATYPDVGVLRDQALLTEPLETGRAIVRQSNLGAVAKLVDDLNAYIETGGEWAHFPRREILERTYDAMIDVMRR
jgi:hypothetical protein